MYYNSPYYNSDLTMQPLQPNQMNPQTMSQMQSAQQQVRSTYSTPPSEANIRSGGFKFTVVKDNETPRSTDIVVDNAGEVLDSSTKKKRGRPKKSEQSTIIGAAGVNDDKNQDIPTMYTYQETTDMLRGTLVQIDQLAGQVKHELDAVAANRTLKSKYNVMVGLSGNLGDIINTKISAIKEINNAISKSNEMDYKKEKDRKAALENVNDDKYIMDMYNAFVQNPANANNRAALGPTNADATLMGVPNIIRASTDTPQSGFAPDTGYLSYVTNMTPEQRLMSLEDNPNIKLCVIFDAATGNKSFQNMDMSTGQVVPGLPVRDQMFMEDTTLDLKNNIAKNINLNETYPLVVINQQIANEY